MTAPVFHRLAVMHRWRFHPLLLASALLAVAAPLQAHSGRTDASGCHHDRRNGGHHCHGGGRAIPAPGPAAASSTLAPATTAAGAPYYRNCDAARAAGVAPLRRGEPGYAPHLDRDNDGIACEPPRRR